MDRTCTSSPPGAYIRRTLEERHGNLVNSVCFSPDRRMVVSGSWDRTVRLWDVETGVCVSASRAQDARGARRLGEVLTAEVRVLQPRRAARTGRCGCGLVGEA